MMRIFSSPTGIVLFVLLTSCASRQTYKIIEGDQPRKKAEIVYGGGNGESYEEAVIIEGARNQKEGVAAEYDFIAEIYGKKGKDWKVTAQSMSKEGNKIFDIVEIRILDTEDRYFYYFDITDCTWKSED
ncbi:MAG: hypothetical protein GF401_18135 [Chitinivibrionales bacterium]|nr:hypothetical protein [Chitinivibrionales bacterium]